MDDQTIQIVSSKLRAGIVFDTQRLNEIHMELKEVMNESKSWRMEAHDTSSILSRNQEKITVIENQLSHSCMETGEIKNMKWFYHQIHKDVGFYCIKNTRNGVHDPYIGTVIDLMTQYEQNCRRKEELENMLNQVHRKLTKLMTRHAAQQAENSASVVQEDSAELAFTCMALESDEGVQENAENVENGENESHLAQSRPLQSRKKPQRRPLALLDLNLCRENNSNDTFKTDPLNRVRSPVLSAYLKKKDQL